MQPRRAVLLTALVGVAATVSGAAFAFQPSGERQLLMIVLGLTTSCFLLGWIILAVGQRVRRKRVAWTGLCVAVLSFGSCWAGPDLGRDLSDRRFRKDLAAYEQVVAQLRQQPLRRLSPIPSDSLPPQLRGRVSHVMSWRGPAGEFGVDFHYGGGFPVKHSAYVYYEGNATRLGPESPFRWHHGRQLAPHWFAVTD